MKDCNRRLFLTLSPEPKTSSRWSLCFVMDKHSKSKFKGYKSQENLIGRDSAHSSGREYESARSSSRGPIGNFAQRAQRAQSCDSLQSRNRSTRASTRSTDSLDAIDEDYKPSYSNAGMLVQSQQPGGEICNAQSKEYQDGERLAAKDRVQKQRSFRVKRPAEQRVVSRSECGTPAPSTTPPRPASQVFSGRDTPPSSPDPWQLRQNVDAQRVVTNHGVSNNHYLRGDDIAPALPTTPKFQSRSVNQEYSSRATSQDQLRNNNINNNNVLSTSEKAHQNREQPRGVGTREELPTLRRSESVQSYVVNKGTRTAYVRGRLLGKGGFAKCYELTDLSTKRTFACKIIPKTKVTKPAHREKIDREVELHKELQHKNIVGFYSYFDDNENVYIVLENCTRKSLVHVLRNRRSLTEPEVRYYLRQLTEGCRYIHSKSIIHRDLKLGNMLLNESMQIKIADFGLATKVMYEGEKKMTVCGTPNYIAPEVLSKKGHSFEADIWAIGCIMYAMLVGRPPFETATLKETYLRIVTNSFFVPGHVSQPSKNLINRLLTGDPVQRPPLNRLLQHEFFTHGYTPASLPTYCCDRAPNFTEEMRNFNFRGSNNNNISDDSRSRASVCSSSLAGFGEVVGDFSRRSHSPMPTSAGLQTPDHVTRKAGGFRKQANNLETVEEVDIFKQYQKQEELCQNGATPTQQSRIVSRMTSSNINRPPPSPSRTPQSQPVQAEEYARGSRNNSAPQPSSSQRKPLYIKNNAGSIVNRGRDQMPSNFNSSTPIPSNFNSSTPMQTRTSSVECGLNKIELSEDGGNAQQKSGTTTPKATVSSVVHISLPQHRQQLTGDVIGSQQQDLVSQNLQAVAKSQQTQYQQRANQLEGRTTREQLREGRERKKGTYMPSTSGKISKSLKYQDSNNNNNDSNTNSNGSRASGRQYISAVEVPYSGQQLSNRQEGDQVSPFVEQAKQKQFEVNFHEPSRPQSYAVPVSPAEAFLKISSSLAHCKSSSKSELSTIASSPIIEDDIETIQENTDNDFGSTENLLGSDNKPVKASAILLYKALKSCLESKPAVADARASAPHIQPDVMPVWVTKWVDYSNKYGFGFQLSDRSVGVLFNDLTRILLSRDGKTIHYNDLSNKVFSFSTNSPPRAYKKKTSLLLYFAQYMDEHLIHGGNVPLQSSKHSAVPEPSDITPSVFMKKWFRTSKAIVMYLRNGTLQVNFFDDHTKIILNHSVSGDFIVTFINSRRQATPYSLSHFLRFGCSLDVEDRLKYARRMLEKIINIEGVIV